ncbi:MAG: zinc dependent phospholipase C family protein [Gemmatimonadales bacterium]
MRWFLLFAGSVLLVALFPTDAHAWTPGTHIYLAESILSQAGVLPGLVGDLLRAFPYDYLYGSIAADTSFAKKHAPVGRHPHHWHVGQEIHDAAESDALRAFGLGYLSHLAADVVAHNYFVPRQLVVSPGPAGVAHAYWEARVENTLGTRYSREAMDLLRMDHTPADRLLDTVLSPTLFSIPTNRRMFRGMVRIADQRSYQATVRLAHQFSGVPLTDEDVGRHLERSRDEIIAMLAAQDEALRLRDPSGEAALKAARIARKEIVQLSGRDIDRLRSEAEKRFGLPLPAARRVGG